MLEPACQSESRVLTIGDEVVAFAAERHEALRRLRVGGTGVYPPGLGGYLQGLSRGQFGSSSVTGSTETGSRTREKLCDSPDASCIRSSRHTTVIGG